MLLVHEFSSSPASGWDEPFRKFHFFVEIAIKEDHSCVPIRLLTFTVLYRFHSIYVH